MIYLDNAATTKVKPQAVIDAVVEAMTSLGNAGRGTNDASLSASRLIYDTRERLCRLFGGTDPRRVAFTCNSTEALNIAIKGTVNPGDHVVTTVLEHNSVLRPLYEMESQGAKLTVVGCEGDASGNATADIPLHTESVQREGNGYIGTGAEEGAEESEEKARKGRLDYQALERAITEDTKVVVCTHASNLTGNVVDVKRVAKMAHEKGAILIVDASQTAGVFPIHVQEMDIDILCFTGHKGLLGPQGTGGIYVREGLEIRPFKSGGTGVQTYSKTQPAEMPTLLEAGTLNGHGIAGLNAALRYLEETGIDAIRDREQALMRRFYEGLRGIPELTFYGDFTSGKEKCAVVSLNIGDYDSGEVSDALLVDYGISTRPGGHCAPRMHEALGTADQGAVRFSFSHFNTEEEVDAAVRAVIELATEP